MAAISNISRYDAALPAEQNTNPTDDVAADAEANKEMFLKLLVAQLQNQDPSSPADPIQFVTQLAQFTSLEQTIGMRQELESIHQVLVDANTPATSTDNSAQE